MTTSGSEQKPSEELMTYSAEMEGGKLGETSFDTHSLDEAWKLAVEWALGGDWEKAEHVRLTVASSQHLYDMEELMETYEGTWDFTRTAAVVYVPIPVDLNRLYRDAPDDAEISAPNEDGEIKVVLPAIMREEKILVQPTVPPGTFS